MRIQIISIIVVYIILASICCEFMAIIFYYPLNLFNDVKIVASPIISGLIPSDKYYHVYLLVNEKAYEPRFLGLFLKNSIDYNTILFKWNNPKEYFKTNNIIPFY